MTPPPQFFERQLLQLRREVDDVIRAQPLFCERRGLLRERLRRGRTFARHITRRHGSLDDWPEWFTPRTLEHVGEARLTEQRHTIDWPAVARHTEQHGSRGRIIIPQPVMYGLEMPDAFAGTCVEYYERFREQIVALATAAVPVVARRAHRQIDESARG